MVATAGIPIAPSRPTARDILRLNRHTNHPTLQQSAEMEAGGYFRDNREVTDSLTYYQVSVILSRVHLHLTINLYDLSRMFNLSFRVCLHLHWTIFRYRRHQYPQKGYSRQVGRQ